MKSFNQQILSILEDNPMVSTLESKVQSHGQNEHGDVSLSEAVERFTQVSVLLKEEITSGRFDDVAQNRRAAILKNLEGIRQHVNNPAQIIQNVESLYDHLTISGLFYR